MRTLIGILAFLLWSDSAAQTVHPMKQRFVSFSHTGAVRTFVSNPYDRRMQFHIEAFGADWLRAEDVHMPRPVLTLGAGGTGHVIALVPLQGAGSREIYLCATASVVSRHHQTMRGRVCGRYTIERLSY